MMHFPSFFLSFEEPNKPGKYPYSFFMEMKR